MLLDVREIENVAQVAVTCESCGTLYTFEVDYEGYLAWRHEGKLLQHALPENTHGERELLLTSTCGPCYDALFVFDYDEDEED